MFENQFELGKQKETISFYDVVLLKLIINRDILVSSNYI